jgi:hypothetical protein
MEAKNLARIKISWVFILALIPLTIRAQNLVVPQKEFNLFCPKEALEFSRGDTGQLDIIILRSISYRKSKVKMGVSSTLPKGVEITFNPDNDNFDHTKANIVIHTDATPGQYLLILNATLQHKTKASILKLSIK